MEEMMKLDRKTGEKTEVPANMYQATPNRKQMREMLLPKVGDFITENHRVIYVNSGQFRFSAEGSLPLPSAGSRYENEGRVYEVERTDDAKGRFNAKFIGFKQNPVIAPPLEVDDDLAKVI